MNIKDEDFETKVEVQNDDEDDKLKEEMEGFLKKHVVKCDKYDNEDRLVDIENDEVNETLKKFKIKGDQTNPFRVEDQARMAIRDQLTTHKKNSRKTYVEKVLESKKGVERGLEEGEKKLAELVKFGNELIGNIHVTNQKREVQRQKLECMRQSKLEEDMYNDTMQVMDDYNEMDEKWDMLQEITEPYELHTKLDEQKRRVANVMSQKDKMIEKCQEELEHVSEMYEEEIEKHADDIYFLTERIDNQLEMLKKCFDDNAKELRQIVREEKVAADKDRLLRFNILMDQMTKRQNKNIDVLKVREEYFIAELEVLRQQQYDITASIEQRLRKEADQLQVDMIDAKNRCFRILEKLDYNEQVLAKLTDENAHIHNMQKRRVGRLRLRIVDLRKKMEARAKETYNITRRMTNDIAFLTKEVRKLERGVVTARLGNRQKLRKVCELKVGDWRSMMDRVLDVDKVLHQQQLCVEWTKPDTNVELFRRSKISESADKLPSQMISTRPRSSDMGREKMICSRILRQIMPTLTDNAGFLVDTKVIKLLESYSECDRSVMMLDHIFGALKLKNLMDIVVLSSYFEPYAWCPNCSKDPAHEGFKELLAADRVTESVSSSKASLPCTSSKVKIEAGRCQNHKLWIEPSLVVLALKNFADHNVAARKRVIKNKAAERQAIEDELKPIFKDKSDINRIWQQIDRTFTPKQENRWTLVEHSLKHYIDVLKERDRLDAECNELRRQYTELKRMFQKYEI